jgi:uncharacterized protein (DUF58 family)
MKEVRRLQIRSSRRVDALFAGEYHSAFRGQGIEFADVREYAPGDDVRTIDWNVTARSGRTHVKRFIEERQLTVILAIDQSASGGFASAGRLKSEIAIEVGAVLALAATKNNDRVGLALFTDHIESFVPPRKGRGHILRLMRDMLEFRPQGHGTDIPTTLLSLRTLLRRRALIFLISDFLAPPAGEAGFDRALRRLAMRHEVIAVRITDPRDREIPSAGVVRTIDPESGRTAWIDTSSGRVRRALAARAAAHESALTATLRRARVDRVDVSTNRPFVADLARYFELRERGRRSGVSGGSR